MLSCKAIRFLFRISPFSAWRYALLDRHLLRCPECLKEVADVEAARSATFPRSAAAEATDFWPAFARRLAREGEAERRSRAPLWRWAAGAAGLLALAGVLLIVFAPRPEFVDPAIKLSVESIKIYDEPGRAIIFQGQDPDKTFVWVEKQ